MTKILIVILMQILLSAAPIKINQQLSIGEQQSVLQSETQRYQEISEAIIRVSQNAKPLESNSEFDVIKKIALISAIAVTESNLNKDVQYGIVRGDKGRSVCLMQMNIGKAKTPEGWFAEDLTSDLDKCLTAGLRAAKQSIGACSHLKSYVDRLGGYTTGKCSDNEPESRKKMNLMFYYYSKVIQQIKKQK